MILRLLFVFALTARSAADSPTSSSVGDEFLLAFFPSAPNKVLAKENVLHITSTSPGHCTIDYRDNFQSQMYVEIGSEQTTEVMILSAAQVGAVVESKGIRVSCSHPVSLHASYRSPSTLPSSVMVVLPVSSLSEKYFIPGFPGQGYVGIVSTRDNNVVVIALTTTCNYVYRKVQYNTDDTITESLSDGDVLFLYGSDCDFAGAMVESTYPVAVFSGSIDIPNSGPDGTDDMVCLQVLPLHMWGTEFIISEAIFSGNVTRMARILVAKNSTTLTKYADGKITETLYNLTAGQYIEQKLTPADTYFYRSSSPVSITILVFSSQGTTYFQSPSLNLYQRDALVPNFETFETYVLITAKTDEIHKIQINNQVVSEKMWANITSVNLAYSMGILPMKGDRTVDVNHVSDKEEFSAQVYGRSLVEFVFNVGYGSYTPSPYFIDYWDSKLQMSCGPDSWDIAVNETTFSFFGDFAQLFANLKLGGRCLGTRDGQKVVFKAPLQDCGTKREVIAGKNVYKNYLTFHSVWRYNIICSPGTLAPSETSGKIIGSYVDSIQTPTVSLKLFADIDYKHEISKSPLTVGMRDTVYVEVIAPDSMGLIMVVNECSIKSHMLIFNRCAYDRTVSILSTTNHVTRFTFRENGLFSNELVDLRCDVHFCVTSDRNAQCQQNCPSHNGPAIGK